MCVFFENKSGRRIVGKWCRDEKRLSHQARLLWQTSSAPHPNVATGLGRVTYCGRKLLLMEHVSGGPLRSMMEVLVKTPTCRFSEKTDACRYLVFQTLKGLAHLHQQGIIHRDI
jgi:serine/threonine protein kinase